MDSFMATYSIISLLMVLSFIFISRVFTSGLLLQIGMSTQLASMVTDLLLILVLYSLFIQAHFDTTQLLDMEQKVVSPFLEMQLPLALYNSFGF